MYLILRQSVVILKDLEQLAMSKFSNDNNIVVSIKTVQHLDDVWMT